MKLIRLQSGPLACVYQEEQDTESLSRESGVYHAFSGSVEGEGASESEALAALDRNLGRLSEPPSPMRHDNEPALDTLRCGERCDSEPSEYRLESRQSASDSRAPDTVPSPRLSSLRALAAR